MSGVVLAAMAGIAFGLFQALNRRVNAAIDVYRGTFAVLAVSTSLLVLISVVTDDLSSLATAPAAALGAFAAAGIVHFFLGWTFLGLAQQRLGAARTGALLGSVPLVGAVLAAVVLGEALTLRTLAALLVVVCGVVAISLRPRARDVDPRRSSTVSLPGLGLALATATCWSVSPLLIRGGLDLFPAPLPGVTVGIATTTVVYGIAVVSSWRANDGPLGRPQLSLIALTGIVVGLAIWWQWTAFELAPIGVALAVMQLSAPVVALVSPLLSSDPLERGGALLWVGLALVLTGVLTFLLGG